VGRERREGEDNLREWRDGNSGGEGKGRIKV